MKKLLLIASSMLLLASCNMPESNVASELPSSEEGTSIESVEETSEAPASLEESSVAPSSEEATSEEESVERSSEEITSEELSSSEASSEVPSGIVSMSLSGGSHLENAAMDDGYTLSIDAETGVVLLQKNGVSVLQRFQDEGMEAGMIDLESENVVSVENGKLNLEYGSLTIEEKGEFYLVTYSLRSLNRHYLFLKEGEEALSTMVRYESAGAYDLNYGYQYLILVDGHGYVYCRNQEVEVGLDLYSEEKGKKVSQILDDGVYYLKNGEEVLCYIYYVNDIFVRNSIERGTYTRDGKADLVLDGFGHYVLGDLEGTYVWQRAQDNSLYLKDENGKMYLYFLDFDNGTYAPHSEEIDAEPTESTEESSIVAETSPIPLGAYVEGLNYVTAGSNTFVLEIHISFSNFIANRIAEFMYSLRSVGETFAMNHVNLGACDYVYSQGFIYMTLQQQQWSFEVTNNVSRLVLKDNPLGIDTNTVTAAFAIQVASDD